MSFFKATWWRPATALAVLALAVGIISLTGAGTAQAGITDGSVTVNPQPELDIGAGGTGTVTIDMTPASAGTSVWIIQVSYDPAVAQVATSGGNPVCTFISVQSPFIGAGGCDTKAVSHGSTQDTLVILGGVVQNDNGTPKGFTTPQQLATFSFQAVGASGAISPLSVVVTSFLGPNGETPTPAITNGSIHITTPVGVSRIWGDVNCSGTFNGGDAINVDRFLVSLPRTGNPPADCPAIDATVTVNGGTPQYGDVNCSGGVTGGDAVNIDRALVSLPVTPTPPGTCPVMGTAYLMS